MKKRIVNILLTMVVLVLVAINIIIFMNNNLKKAETETLNDVKENVIDNPEQVIKNSVDNKVAELPEKNRMQIYFGTFMQYIEDKKYDEAYNLLNENFKSNYFPSIEKFEEYVQKYPKDITIEYQNLERQGELFVLTVQIKDVFDKNVEPITQRVVIRELEANKFTLSFQVE